MSKRDESLVDYLFDELHEGESDAFERRLSEDAELAAEAKRLRSVLGVVRSVQPEEPPAWLDARILAAAREEATALASVPWWRRWLTRPAVGLAFAATAAIAIAIVSVPMVSHRATEESEGVPAVAMAPKSAPEATVLPSAPVGTTAVPSAGLDELAQREEDKTRARSLLHAEERVATPRPRDPAKRETIAEFPREDLRRSDRGKGRGGAGQAESAPDVGDAVAFGTAGSRGGEASGGLAPAPPVEAQQEATAELEEKQVGGALANDGVKAKKAAAPRQVPPADEPSAPARAPAGPPPTASAPKKDAPQTVAAPGKVPVASAGRVANEALEQAERELAAHRVDAARQVLLTARLRLPASPSYDRVTLRLARLERAAGKEDRARVYAQEAAWSKDPDIREAARRFLAAAAPR